MHCQLMLRHRGRAFLIFTETRLLAAATDGDKSTRPTCLLVQSLERLAHHARGLPGDTTKLAKMLGDYFVSYPDGLFKSAEVFVDDRFLVMPNHNTKFVSVTIDVLGQRHSLTVCCPILPAL